MENIIVSICTQTYNHESFISKCLEGFLQQKTSFAFEILVHDDASTDHTVDIVKEYESKYPDLFRCVYQNENQFHKKNTLVNILFPMSRGKYIAICEGDDYWTDPYKLQKQVDFLEKNADFSCCFHNVQILKDGKLYEDDMQQVNSITTIYDLARQNYIRTVSYMFRNNLIKEFPDEIQSTTGGDYFLFMLVAKYGKIKKLPDVMAIYRKQDQGIWSSQDSISRFKTMIKNVEVLFPHFDMEITQILKEHHAERIFRFAFFLAENGSMEEEKEFLLSRIRINMDSVLKRLAAIVHDNSRLISQQKSLKFTINNMLRLAKKRLGK